jgi:hypothetical protein
LSLTKILPSDDHVETEIEYTDMSLDQRYRPDYGFSFDVLELRLICPSDRVRDFVLAPRRLILEKEAGITQGTQCHQGDMS